MYLTHLSLTNFRSYARLDVDVPRRLMLLIGNNAQGKTTVLEAIYFLATFTSFQTHSDRQLINFVAARDILSVARLVAEYKRGVSTHRLEVRLILEPVGPVNGQRMRKEILLDGVKRTLSDVIGHFNAVIFVPQMTQIIEGSPDERRRYLNLALAQAVPGYARTLGEYTQAITQRNALLKALNERNGDPSQLDFWDETIARNGAALMQARIAAVEELGSLAGRIHSDLTHGVETLRIEYQPSYDPIAETNGQIAMQMETVVDRSSLNEDDIRKGFLTRLKDVRSEEIARGITTIGPHRDEMRFLANTCDLGDFGSRGQVRTTLLALKLAEVEWMKQKTGQLPVLLFDEVLAELDVQRRADLLTTLDRMDQAFITTTDIGLFPAGFVGGTVIWEAAAGTLKVKQDGGETHDS